MRVSCQPRIDLTDNAEVNTLIHALGVGDVVLKEAIILGELLP